MHFDPKGEVGMLSYFLEKFTKKFPNIRKANISVNCKMKLQQ